MRREGRKGCSTIASDGSYQKFKRWMRDDGEGLREGSYWRAIAHLTLWTIAGTVKRLPETA